MMCCLSPLYSKDWVEGRGVVHGASGVPGGQSPEQSCPLMCGSLDAGVEYNLKSCSKVVRCGVCCRSTRVRPWASVTLSTPVSVSSCPTPVTLLSRWRLCPPSWLANSPPPSPSFTPSTSVRGLGYTTRSPKTFC